MKKRSGVGFGEKIETKFALEGTRICFYVVVPLDFQTLLAERRNKESRLCLIFHRAWLSAQNSLLEIQVPDRRRIQLANFI